MVFSFSAGAQDVRIEPPVLAAISPVPDTPGKQWNRAWVLRHFQRVAAS